MRKLIWCCTAAAVLAAGSLLSLAHYACRCPDSLVGRSMQVLAEASIAIQPLSGLTSLAMRTNHAALASDDTATPIEMSIPDDPLPVAPEPAPAPNGFTKQVGSVTEREFVVEAAPIVIDEDDPVPAAEGVAVNDPGTIEIAGMDGQEVPPKGFRLVMPHCQDDDDEAAAPPKMPRADTGEEAEHTVFKAWMELFEEGKESKKDKSPSVEELPPPTEEGPQSEPKCQEDSHLHEQYPGCPRTTCPYRSKGKSSTPPPASTFLPYNFNKNKGKEESSEEPPHHDKDKEECPRTKGVDTMEYRKSDAGLDEFGPGPLH